MTKKQTRRDWKVWTPAGRIIIKNVATASAAFRQAFRRQIASGKLDKQPLSTPEGGFEGCEALAIKKKRR